MNQMGQRERGVGREVGSWGEEGGRRRREVGGETREWTGEIRGFCFNAVVCYKREGGLLHGGRASFAWHGSMQGDRFLLLRGWACDCRWVRSPHRATATSGLLRDDVERVDDIGQLGAGFAPLPGVCADEHDEQAVPGGSRCHQEMLLLLVGLNLPPACKHVHEETPTKSQTGRRKGKDGAPFRCVPSAPLEGSSVEGQTSLGCECVGGRDGGGRTEAHKPGRVMRGAMA